MYVFFGEMSIEVFFPFFNWVIFIIVVELYELLDYFGNQALVCHIICKYFLPLCRTGAWGTAVHGVAKNKTNLVIENACS